MFEDVRYKEPGIRLLSVTDPDILKQSSYTDYGTNIKTLASEKFHRQRKLKNYVAVQKTQKLFLLFKCCFIFLV